MGKLVIRLKGKAPVEVNLKLGDVKIGRKAGCDIILEDPAVSGEHAIIRSVGTTATLIDLNSTNGTFVENKRVKQHPLRNGETILIGGHTLIYRDGLDLATPMKPVAPASLPPQEKTTVLMQFAQLLGVEGKDKGKRLPLIKEVNVLENPGKNPARITRTSEGYLIEAPAGPGEPRLNDRPIPPGGQLLENGDVVEAGGTKYQFYSK
jgi:pSer/pThr/pTyr-binding forkhead associated (FHA) protein